MKAGRKAKAEAAQAPAEAAAAPADDRREHSRILTVFRVARLNIDSDTGLCRIQNISDTGMMLVTSLGIAPGDTVMIALSDKIVLPGQVSWADGARVGIEFIERIDAASVLQSIAEAAPAEHRPIRLPTDTAAVAITEHGTRAVRIVDISQGGMKISHEGGIAVGMLLKIGLPNGLQRRAVVRWANENMAGLKLFEPIAYQELESARKL